MMSYIFDSASVLRDGDRPLQLSANFPRSFPRLPAQLGDTPRRHQLAPEERRLLDHVGATRAARHARNALPTNAALASSPAGIPHDGRLARYAGQSAGTEAVSRSFRTPHPHARHFTLMLLGSVDRALRAVDI